MASNISVANASSGTLFPTSTLLDATSNVATPVDASHSFPIAVGNSPTPQSVSIGNGGVQ